MICNNYMKTLYYYEILCIFYFQMIETAFHGSLTDALYDYLLSVE